MSGLIDRSKRLNDIKSPPIFDHSMSLVKLKEEDAENNILSVMSSDDKKYFLGAICLRE